MPSPEEMQEFAEFQAWKEQQRGAAAAPSAEAQFRALQARTSVRPPSTPKDFKAPKVTTAGEWKRSRGAEIDLALPSGNVCRVKRPGLPALLSNGVIPDMLTPLAQKAVDNADTGAPTDISQAEISSIMGTKEGQMAIFDAAARVIVHCVVEPVVLYHRREMVGHPDGDFWEDIPDDERDPEALYSDDVDVEDQMFIFQYVVGGSKDLQSFR